VQPIAIPAADDDWAYVFVDHREMEESIVHYVAERLAPEHTLTAREDGEDLFVTYRSQEHRLPLTISRHDRYVAISSLAELLKDDYRFFVLALSLDSDTHGLLVAPVATVATWGPLPSHLQDLKPGFDYFSGINVPYLNHEAPNFARDAEGVHAASEAMGLMINSLFSGKTDPAAATALARAAMMDPKIKDHPDFPKGASEADIAAEIEKAMQEALQDPEVRGYRREMNDALAELRGLTGARAKPWWKFW
jgi:hypothetical protein